MSVLAASAPAASSEEIQQSLTKLPPAPRLYLLRGEEQQLKEKLAADPGLDAVWNLVRRSADRILDEPPVERTMQGRRLLAESRRCLRRMTHLGMAYRLTGDVRYAERGKQEMLAAAAFSDWNPSHFLDTAEMSAALAIGVDWLHDALDDQTRATIRAAIVKHGLEPSLKVTHWVKGTNNWNQVCHAGMVLGALVVAEEQPKLAADLIARAIDGLPHSMKEYAPDGAYPEGASYWDYGTSFNVLVINALQQALGSDFGLLNQPGFDRTAEYMLHVGAPSGYFFSYADAGQGSPNRLTPAMFYLAKWRNDPSLLFQQRETLARLIANPDMISPNGTDRLLPLMLVWAKPGQQGVEPTAHHYLGRGMTPVAMFRSGWGRDATFAGIKGGKASAPHGHMDAGQFLLEFRGVRFAEDLGMQDYHSLESIGVKLWDGSPTGDRWRVFRLAPESHNILMVDGKHHDLQGRAEFVESSPNHAKLDLTPVYKDQLQRATRELRLNPDDSVTLTDEVQATDAGGTVRWAMLTKASVTLEESGATLVRDGKTVRLRVVSDKPVAMKTYVSDPPPREFDVRNPGTQMVGFEVALTPGETRSWRVEFAAE